MVQHFNIGKKEVINPFEKVNYVRVTGCSEPVIKLAERFHKQSSSVNTRKVNDRWLMLFSIKLLDFPTIINWFDIDRGTFKIRGKRNHSYVPMHTIHFLIEDDVLVLW